MTIYLEFRDDSSQKFWEAKQSGSQITIRNGKINTDGRITDKKYNSDTEAKESYIKLVRQKLKKGYKRLGEITNKTDLDIKVYNHLDEVKEDIIYPRSFLDYGYLGEEVVVINGNMQIEGDFYFDCILPEIFEKHLQATYIFIGDITVSGYFMFNTSALVIGSVKTAHYEHHGLAYLYIQEKMQVSGALIGADDHGTLEVKNLDAFFTVIDWNAGFVLETDMSFWRNSDSSPKGFLFDNDSKDNPARLNKKEILTIFSGYGKKVGGGRGLINFIVCMPDTAINLIKKYIDSKVD